MTHQKDIKDDDDRQEWHCEGLKDEQPRRFVASGILSATKSDQVPWCELTVTSKPRKIKTTGSRPIPEIFTSYRSRDAGLSNALLIVRIDQILAEYQAHLNWYWSIECKTNRRIRCKIVGLLAESGVPIGNRSRYAILGGELLRMT